LDRLLVLRQKFGSLDLFVLNTTDGLCPPSASVKHQDVITLFSVCECFSQWETCQRAPDAGAMITTVRSCFFVLAIMQRTSVTLSGY
jgi:hypothetical protein